jgi:hypothetical protein
VDLNERHLEARPGTGSQPVAQLLYARLLDWATRVAFAVLVASFAVYLLGWLTPHVPLDTLPGLWNQPVAAYLERAAMPTGWGWVGLLREGDTANLGGIALLTGASLLPLLAVVPLYLKQRDWPLALICVLQITVIVLAASGVLTAGH